MEFIPDKCQRDGGNICKLQINTTLLILHTEYVIVSYIKSIPCKISWSIVIDKHLSWSEHNSQIIKKADSAEAFLQCNLNCCPIPVKATYISYTQLWQDQF